MSVTFYAVAFVTIFLIALLKGAFGGGFALIGVPILSNFISPIEAAAIIAPLVCLMDLFALAAYPPRTWNRAQLKVLIPGSMVGMALGTILLGRAAEGWIALIVGLIATLFSLQWFMTRGRGKPVRSGARRPSSSSGWAWGAASGFTSLLAHAGGPPLAMYLLPQRLPKTELAGTQTVFFMVGNYMKLLPYVMLGRLDLPTLKTAVALAAAVPLGVGLGRLLHGRLDQARIYMGCYALTLLAGLHMLAEVVLHGIR